jgi:hypothetical protein
MGLERLLACKARREKARYNAVDAIGCPQPTAESTADALTGIGSADANYGSLDFTWETIMPGHVPPGNQHLAYSRKQSSPGRRIA